MEGMCLCSIIPDAMRRQIPCDRVTAAGWLALEGMIAFMPAFVSLNVACNFTSLDEFGVDGVEAYPGAIFFGYMSLGCGVFGSGGAGDLVVDKKPLVVRTERRR